MDTIKLLETYTLAEILEYCDVTEDEALNILMEEGYCLNLPPIPVDA